MAPSPPPQLPSQYEFFSEVFDKLTDSLQVCLAGMLAHFARSSAFSLVQQPDPAGEFAGYDGLHSRGDLKDLVESEWALRRFAPLEFLRRVSEGEALYRLKRMEAENGRRILPVVFESGPWMLGRNRLLALAALAYFARYAQQRGATLLWTLSGVHMGWKTGFTLNGIRLFLQHSSPVASGQDRSLEEAFAALPKGEIVESWGVSCVPVAGADAFSGSQAFTGHMQLEVPPGVEDAQVNMRSGAQVRRFPVALPEERLAAQALEMVIVAPINWENLPGPAVGSRFPDMWMFDRHNDAFLISVGDGVAWLPRVAERPKVRPLYVGLKACNRLLAVQPRSLGRLLVLMRVGVGDKVALVQLGNRLGKPCVEHQVVGRCPVELGSGFPLAGLFVSTGFGWGRVACEVVDHDGNVVPLAFGTAQPPQNARPRSALVCDGSYLAELHTANQKDVIRVRKANGRTVATHHLESDRDLNALRNALGSDGFSASFDHNSKAFTFANREGQFVVFQDGKTHHFTLKNARLMHGFSASSVLVWKPREEKVNLINPAAPETGQVRAQSFRFGPRDTPHFCPHQRVGYVLKSGEAQGDTRLEQLWLPDRLNGGAEVIDVVQEMQFAAVIWL